MLLLLLVVTLISISDTRQILGLNPWIKPMKFMISITIFLWTVAWFMPDTVPPRPVVSGFSRIDKRQVVRWTIASSMVIEIVMIVLQAARGTTSHFNVRSNFDGIVFGIMGIAIVFNTLAMVLFLGDHPPRHAAAAGRLHLGHSPRRGDVPARQPARER